MIPPETIIASFRGIHLIALALVLGTLVAIAMTGRSPPKAMRLRRLLRVIARSTWMICVAKRNASSLLGVTNKRWHRRRPLQLQTFWSATMPTGATCVGSEPETWTTFAILLGLRPNVLGGWWVRVNRTAWLRAAWHSGQPGDWNSPQTLAARVQDIIDHPLAATLPGGHVHIR